MNFEKFVNSKFYGVVDWILKLLIINFFVLILIPPIITITPAFVTGYSTIKHFRTKRNDNIFIVIFNKFKEHFLKSFLCGLIIIPIIGILVFAVIFYNQLSIETNHFFYIFAWAFLIFSLLIILVIFFQLPMIIEYFNFRLLDNFRFGFFMSIRFISLTLILIVIWGLSIALLFFSFSVWIGIGLAGALFLVDVFSRRYYDIISQGVKNQYKEDKENNHD